MYKFTNHLTNAKLVLVRRHVGESSYAALIVMRAPHRQYATKDKCDAAPKRPKSTKLFWGAVGATVLTGASIVYAKNSPDARNWLESNIPWANDVVALVYQENTTYWKAATNQFNRTTTYLSHFMFGKEGVTPPEVCSRSEQDIEKDAAIKFAKKTYQLPPPVIEPLYVEEKVVTTPQIESKATLVQTDKCEPQTAQEVKITKDMVELEQEMHENTKIAIDNYKLATQYCADYNKALFKIIEASLDDLDKKYFNGLQGLQQQMHNAHVKAKAASAKAKCAIENLDRMIKTGMKAPPESQATTKRYIKQFRADLIQAEKNFSAEQEKSVISDKYWNKVEAARTMFKDELQALFPGLDLSARKLNIRGDTDVLLVYALKRIQFLQNQLAEAQTIRDLKINRAIECHDEKAIIEAKAEDIIMAERMVRETEFMKKSMLIQAEANRQTKEALKKQLEIQQEVMHDRIAKKEKEMMANFNRAVSEQVEAERVEFKKELAAMAGKLKAIEQTLKQRAAAEAEARRSQSLWAAAEALLAATRRPAAQAKVDNELSALAKAGKDDKLVESVLKGIPADVREKGIATEKSLRDRFETLEKTAMKVALVGREGASLPVYFLSWVQSLLLFKQFAEIPQEELENQPTDFTKLDTFDIIHRARYHMDHGNLPAALRYVNLLQGAPRAAAKPWLDAARAHLEIRQAAEAVMAHASVSGLLYL
ncbi:MICOS complex subunit Mic60-like isoform X1 [Spodoptera litura]|uniref:MICOS complex subunit MIC60 n=1 Tax=Spodoptera litura TaxID=69820 RepID=A0A9J7IY22_SPOLT|nr:MICOS complex subunit Mic60-like isoform X1 [Spodoptera litura]